MEMARVTAAWHAWTDACVALCANTRETEDDVKQILGVIDAMPPNLSDDFFKLKRLTCLHALKGQLPSATHDLVCVALFYSKQTNAPKVGT